MEGGMGRPPQETGSFRAERREERCQLEVRWAGMLDNNATKRADDCLGRLREKLVDREGKHFLSLRRGRISSYSSLGLRFLY